MRGGGVELGRQAGKVVIGGVLLVAPIVGVQ